MKKKIGIFLLSLLAFNSFSQEDQDHLIVFDLALNMMPEGSFTEKGYTELFLGSFNLGYKYFINDIFSVGCHINHAMPMVYGYPDKNVNIIPAMLSAAFFKYDAFYSAGIGLNYIEYPNSDGKNGFYLGYEFEFEYLIFTVRRCSLHNYIRYSIVRTDIGNLRYVNGGIGLMIRLN